MRKALVRVTFTALLFILAIGLFVPMRTGTGYTPFYAPADVAHAASAAKNVHFTGWYIDPASNEKKMVEGWIKVGERLRLRTEGGPDIYCDGEKFIEVHKEKGFRHVTIRPALDSLLIKPGLSYIRLFHHPGSMLMSPDDINGTSCECRRLKTQEGRRAIALVMDDLSYPSVITVDPNSALPLKWEERSADGRLVGMVEKFEYDINISERVFRVDIPKSMPVIDLSDPKCYVKTERTVARNILSRSGAKMVLDVPAGGMGIVRDHPGLVFEAVGPRGFRLFRLPGRGAYRILGKAVVYNCNLPVASSTVEDRDITIPVS